MADQQDNPYGLPGAGPTGDKPAGSESIFKPLDGSEPQPQEPIYKPLDGSRPAWPAFRPGEQPQSAGPSGQQQTPAPASGQTFVLAGWGQRFLAVVVDNLATMALLMCVTVPAGVALGLTVPEAFAYFSFADQRLQTVADPTPFQILFGAQIVAQPLMIAAFLARWKGQTPGKRLLGLRVVRADGTDLDWRTAVLREVVLRTVVLVVVSLLTFFVAFMANYLMPLWDKERRAGHDVFAKTRVVQADRP